MSKDTKVQDEIDRLTSQFDNLSEKALEILSGPIAEVSFMKMKLNELKTIINREGFIEEYKNGENQFGYKKSAAVEIYNTMIKNYTALMKEIINRFPKSEIEAEEDDGFMKFINDGQ